MTITNSTSAPLVAIVGATGQQGGSVVTVLKASTQQYRIRAFTRDTTKPAALALAQDGVEVVAVNITVENGDAVRTAFQGADIAFIVTNFWEHMSMEREIAEAKLMIEAAEAGGAKRIIWSGLQSPSKASNGKYTHVYHFEGKAQVTEWGRAKFASTDIVFINVDAGFYAQNFAARNPLLFNVNEELKKTGVAIPAPPSAQLPMLDIRDYGKWVRTAIEDPKYAKGGELIAATEYVTVGELVKDLAKATGKNIVHEQVSNEEISKRVVAFGLPPIIGQEMADNYAAFNDVGYYCGKDLTKLSEPLVSWKEFVGNFNWEGAFP